MKNITLLSAETHRRLRSKFRGCSDRFIENLLILVLKPVGKSAEFTRRVAQTLYRSGRIRLKTLVQYAVEILDDDDLELFLRNLFRKEETEKNEVDIDVAICYLDDLGELANRSAKKAGERVSEYLQTGGYSYKIEAAAFRRRVQRLRCKGVKLKWPCDK
jgi:hypothetical protein